LSNITTANTVTHSSGTRTVMSLFSQAGFTRSGGGSPVFAWLRLHQMTVTGY
jgi:hypothetical protein